MNPPSYIIHSYYTNHYHPSKDIDILSVGFLQHFLKLEVLH